MLQMTQHMLQPPQHEKHGHILRQLQGDPPGSVLRHPGGVLLALRFFQNQKLHQVLHLHPR